MEDLVDTIEGPIERSRLVVKDIITEQHGSRSVATEWYLDGKCVRRDAWVSIVGRPH